MSLQHRVVIYTLFTLYYNDQYYKLHVIGLWEENQARVKYSNKVLSLGGTTAARNWPPQDKPCLFIRVVCDARFIRILMS